MVSLELLTKEDLEQFRRSLIDEIKSLISGCAATQAPWLKSKEVKKMLGISACTHLNLRIAHQLASAGLAHQLLPKSRH